jgi:hypothetical protein
MVDHKRKMYVFEVKELVTMKDKHIKTYQHTFSMRKNSHTKGRDKK